jgi:hypothetical protein
MQKPENGNPFAAIKSGQYFDVVNTFIYAAFGSNYDHAYLKAKLLKRSSEQDLLNCLAIYRLIPISWIQHQVVIDTDQANSLHTAVLSCQAHHASRPIIKSDIKKIVKIGRLKAFS